jgi:hypothetical protein
MSNMSLNLNIHVNAYDSLKDKFLQETEKEEKITGVKKIPVRTIQFLNSYFQFVNVYPRVLISEEMFYYPILLQNRKIIFETPILLCLFGLWPYKTEYDKNDKYCIHFSIDDSNQEIKDLHNFLDAMDMLSYQIAQKENLLGKYKYHSSVRPNYKDPSKKPSMRVKVTAQEMETNIYLEDKENFIMTTKDITDLKQIVMHGKYYKALIEMNPIWFSAKRYGVSYKLLALKIVDLPSPFKNLIPNLTP